MMTSGRHKQSRRKTENEGNVFHNGIESSCAHHFAEWQNNKEYNQED